MKVQWNIAIPSNTTLNSLLYWTSSLALCFLGFKPAKHYAVAICNSQRQLDKAVFFFFSNLRVISGRYFPKDEKGKP